MKRNWYSINFFDYSMQHLLNRRRWSHPYRPWLLLVGPIILGLMLGIPLLFGF
jgi:hypothetical protein